MKKYIKNEPKTFIYISLRAKAIYKKIIKKKKKKLNEWSGL